MPRAPIIPDRKVIFTPLEPHLGVMILRNEIEEVRKQKIRLISSDAIDAFREPLVDVEGFSSRYGFGKS